MSLVNEYLQLSNEVARLNEQTRHANLRVSSGMYYDKISRPSSECRQRETDVQFDSDHWDYVRFRTLELIAEQIVQLGLRGDMAEAGVYQGMFAQVMNSVLPTKTLYLFDTFEGFYEDDTLQELANGRISDNFAALTSGYSQTSTSAVLENMPYPDKCVICQGRFAKTSSLIDARYCLVSIDMDYYHPTLDALDYFYPRLVDGGFALVHDYNHDEIRGIKEAVEQFRLSNRNIRTVPIPDQCGTLVLAK